MIASNAEIQFVEIVEFLQSGVIRAGHYHNNYIEQIYVIKGSIRMYVKNLSTLEQVSVTLESGSIATIHPGVAHLFSAVSNSLAVAMGAGSNPFVDRHTFDDFDLSETRAV